MRGGRGGLIVSAILLLFVVPQLQELVRGFEADLPVFTLFVIGLSELFQACWCVILSATIFAAVAFMQAKGARLPSIAR